MLVEMEILLLTPPESIKTVLNVLIFVDLYIG